jgi:hypothetical protein
MAEPTSPFVIWTAVAALILSLSNAGYALYRAARGPDVRAFQTEDVLLLGYPAEEGQPRDLGAVAVFELANTSPDYPDILVDQTIRVLSGGKQVACLSARGDARFAQAADASGGVAAPHTFEAAETIMLQDLPLYIVDVSTRSELDAGALMSRRQLFDQRASRSVVDLCYGGAQATPYSIAQLLSDFSGKTIDLKYEARFSESDGLAVTCSVELSERRVERLRTRGWINAACNNAKVESLPPDPGSKSALARFLDRIF